MPLSQEQRDWFRDFLSDPNQAERLGRMNRSDIRHLLRDYEEYKKEPLPPIKKEDRLAREMNLGPLTRFATALEPIHSEDIKILRKKFGEDRVQTDAQGNIYIWDGKQWRPYNRPGLLPSFTDVAEFAGATPEILGDFAGRGMGFAAGVPLGPPGALVGQSLGGAAMGALGSGIRQGASGLVKKAMGVEGAPIGEVGKEMGTAAVFGAVVPAGVRGVKGLYSGVKGKLVDPITGRIQKARGVKTQDEKIRDSLTPQERAMLDSQEKAIAEEQAEMLKREKELYAEQVKAQNIQAAKSDGGAMEGAQVKNIDDIKRAQEAQEVLPMEEGFLNTLKDEQTAQEMVELAERIEVNPMAGHLFPGSVVDTFQKVLAIRPIAGIFVRKRVKKIQEKVVENIEKVVGKKLSTTKIFDDTLASDLKSVVESTKADLHEKAGQAYEVIDKIIETSGKGLGREGVIPYEELERPLFAYGKSLGLLSWGSKEVLRNGKKVRIKTLVKNPIVLLNQEGTTVEESRRLQNMLYSMLTTIRATHLKNPAGINWKTVRGLANVARKTYETSFHQAGAYDRQLLKIEGIIRGAMGKGFKSPAAKSQFLEANKAWERFMNVADLTSRGGQVMVENVDNEEFLRRIFRNNEKVKNLKKIIGVKATEAFGLRHLGNVISKGLSGGGFSAGRALDTLTKNASAWKEAIGVANYKRIHDNLRYTAVTGVDINPSGTAKTLILRDFINPFTAATEAAGVLAWPVMEAGGRIVGKTAKDKLPSAGVWAGTTLEATGYRKKDKEKFDRGPSAWFARGFSELARIDKKNQIGIETGLGFERLALDPKGRSLVIKYGEAQGLAKRKLLNKIKLHLRGK